MSKFESNIKSGVKSEQITDSELKEHIKEIENISAGPAQLASVILVLLGFKPAAQLVLSKRNDKPEKVKKILNSAGLYTFETMKMTKGASADLAISRSKEIAEKLRYLSAAKNHEEYGTLMGYPQSAIDAFLRKEERLDRDNYPSMKGIVVHFILSKDHWEEEMKVLKKRSQAIKKYAPSIFKKLDHH